MKLEKDTIISHYRILSAIGKGGMGEVYLAEDAKLDRKVAIKFLNDEFSRDADKLNRFVQEAKAASALNHPHILTIHEIGEVDGINYIATEYIEGQTLRERIEADDRPLVEAVKITEQIADALTAAHEAGIIHRDIKPENIMVRRDGYAKILDFGLAKPLRPEAGEEDATVQLIKTNPGMIMGSVRYMSPEQARGKETDERTDIWSLGVVLYEMVTGRNPFVADNMGDSMVAVINKDPEKIQKYVSGPPAFLQEIISKTLQKSPSERYGKMAELATDIKKLRFDLEHNSAENKTVRLEAETGENATILQADGGGQATREQEQRTNPTIAGGGRNRLPIIAGAFVLAALLIFAGWYFLSGRLYSTPTPFSKIKSEQIATAADLDQPILSPDNKLIAYAKIEIIATDVKKQSLIVRQIGTGAEKVIHEVTNQDLDPLTFSPDGEYIYFSVEQFGETSDLYRISTLGDTPKKILENAVRLFISPEGKKIAYTRRRKPNEPAHSMYIADVDGSDPQKVFDREDFPESNVTLGGWLPDGTNFLIGLLLRDGGEGSHPEGSQRIEKGEASDPGGTQLSIGILDLTNKDRPVKERFREFYRGAWISCDSLHFLPSGEGIILQGRKQTSLNQLWQISYPDGKLAKITDDANSYEHVRVSPDGKSLAAITNLELTSLWSIDPASRKVRQLTAGKTGVINTSLSAMPDGRLIFLKGSNLGITVYSMNEDGTDEKGIYSLDKEFLYLLQVSPDGKYFVGSEMSRKDRVSNLYRFKPDGSERKKLTNIDQGGIAGIQVTSDGWVLFSRETFTGRWRDNPSEIMKVSLEGGEAEKLVGLEPSQRDMMPRLSPDGKYLAYRTSLKDESGGKIKEYIRVTEFSDGKAGRKIIEKQVRVPRVRWLPDSSAIIYEKNSDLGNIYKLDLKTQEETQVSDFSQKADTGALVWKRDGKEVLAFRISTISNLVLLKDISGENQ